jgi:hypothetical protein
MYNYSFSCIIKKITQLEITQRQVIWIISVRKVWRYQSYNQKSFYDQGCVIVDVMIECGDNKMVGKVSTLCVNNISPI